MSYPLSEFEHTYKRLYPPALRLAMSMLHDEHEARDVVQNVFVKVWESEIAIENIEAYVIRAVRNNCLNTINKSRMIDRVHQSLTLMVEDDAEATEYRDQQVSLAVKVLLSPREQQVVDSVYRQGLSYKESARLLNISVASINKNIVSSLKKLRTHFNRHT